MLKLLGQLTANDVRQKASSPRSNYRSPRSHSRPALQGAGQRSSPNLDEMDSDEIMKSLRQTTAEIRVSCPTAGMTWTTHKPTSPRMDSDQSLPEGITKLKLDGGAFEDEQFHEGDDDPGQFQPLLTVLSNHSSKFEERKTAMATLMRLSHAGHMPSWEANFKTVLYLLLETLTDIEPSIRALALRVLREILRNQPERFKEYAELTILKILEAHKDVVDVARAAEETSMVLANNIPPEQSIKVLCPIIQTAEVPVNQAAIKMLTKVIEGMAYPEVRLFSQYCSCLSQGKNLANILICFCDLMHTIIQTVVSGKLVSFCLVAIHTCVGDRIKEFLDDLSGSKMKLLNLYIKRAQSEKLSQGSTPSPSSPTSLSTGSR
ncbi:putative CLIP-associating protein 1-A [Apostichopus japonicus]|uniref:Putative CLIP-associating protein 1-A n=1 Tax=Stichopus japonicus TaxID=307972 RepID=A0A2G8JPK0_STIJA|nr:putative CLIP-associating protein 1-A [Apostichopus japonicus]